jgi:hypothetical protein
VTDINKLEDEGKYREALGAGTFDALSLLVGGRTGREPSPTKAINKLAYATGAESIRPLEHLLPDIEKTVAKVGKPKTVGGLQIVIKDVMDGYEQQFNQGLATTKGHINTVPIADALEAKARTLPPTTEGQQIAAQLRNAATEYRKPWTAQELNSERMFRNANAQAFYKKAGAGQMAALRADADSMIDKIVADSARDVLYDEMERQHPGVGFRELKQKQSSVLDMYDKFRDHIERLEASQARAKGAPLSDKFKISAVVNPTGGIHPRMHQPLLQGKVLNKANAAVRKAFGPTGTARMRRIAILSLPISSLATGEHQEGEQKPPDDTK